MSIARLCIISINRAHVQSFYSYEVVSFQNVTHPCTWENVLRTLRDTRSAFSWIRQPTSHYIFRFYFLPLPVLCVNLSRTSARLCAYPFPRPGCLFVSSFTRRNYSICYNVWKAAQRTFTSLEYAASQLIPTNGELHQLRDFQAKSNVLRLEDAHGKSIELQLSRKTCIAQ